MFYCQLFHIFSFKLSENVRIIDNNNNNNNDDDASGTITKGLLKGLGDLKVGGRVETIQMTALLRTARILSRVLETWGDVVLLKLQWKTISQYSCEKL